MTSMKIVQFSRHPTLLTQLRPKFFHPLDLGRPISNDPLLSLTDNQQIKRKDNPRMTLYVIKSFLQVGFRFQYQLITLVWLPIDFFWFRWSQSRPQSNFEKLKTCSSSSSYSKKTRWGQGWAETSYSETSQ